MQKYSRGVSHEKRTKIVLIIVGCVLFIILIIYSMLYDICNNGNAVSMITGFWSAGATAALGAVALWQNKQYKALSEKSFLEVESIQNEIREQTKKTMEAIETLKRIELAKYYPTLEHLPYYYHGYSKKAFQELEEQEYVFQVNKINMSLNDNASLPLEKLTEKYNSFAFVLRNTSEKTIRNFNCSNLKIDGKEPYSSLRHACDISPGQSVVVVIFNFPDYIKGELIELELSFTMCNLVMERYKGKVAIVISFDEETPFSHDICKISPEIDSKNEDDEI